MSNAQAEFESKFHETLARRTVAQEALSTATDSIARLKANVAQARADMATLRADARAVGVKLPKLTQASAPTNDPAGNGYTRDGGPGPEDDEG